MTDTDNNIVNDNCESVLKRNIALILASALLSFTFCFYAPIEMFLINKREFNFGLMTFLWMPTLFAIGTGIVAVGVGLLLRKKSNLQGLYIGIVFAVSVCIYIQANFLNMSVGTMDGKDIDWTFYKPTMMRNAVILIAVFCILFALFAIKPNLLKTISSYMSALLIIMQLTSLVVLLINAANDGRGLKNETPVFTGDGLYEIGDENVLMFIIDAYDDMYFKQIIENSPDFVDELQGFTYFNNFSGTNYESQYGAVPLITGQLFLNQMPTAKEWVESVATERMFYDELMERGYDIGIYEDDMDLIPDRIKSESVDFKMVPLKFYDNFTMFKHLYRMVACKYMPDIIKPYVWLKGTEFSNQVYSEDTVSVFSGENDDFITQLDAQGITVNHGTKAYRAIHLFGAHAPFDIDENGNPTETSHSDYAIVSKGAIRMVEKYLDEMKNQGVYESSTIIITSDHGNELFDGELSNPVLLIKPAGEYEGFTVNNAPVSQVDIPATITQMIGCDNYNDYGISAYDVAEGERRERFIYSYVYGNEHKNISLNKNGIRNLMEYSVPFDAANPLRYEPTGREILPTGEEIDHFKYCDTCINHADRTTTDGFVTWVHIAATDHPIMCDSESWW